MGERAEGAPDFPRNFSGALGKMGIAAWKACRIYALSGANPPDQKGAAEATS